MSSLGVNSEDEQKAKDDNDDFEEMTEEEMLQGIDIHNVDEMLQKDLIGLSSDKPKLFIKKKVVILLRYKPIIQKFGLSPPLFNAIYEILMNQTLGMRDTIRLLQCLLPRQNISEDYVVRIFAIINRKDKNIALTAEMLKWVISVYNVISPKQKIKQLYHVLFHSLYHDSVRAPVCHLLYFITRREHVIPYRVSRLMELIDSEKDNAELIGLLMVYQTYDLKINVPHNVRLVNTLVFKTPFPDMKHQLTNIRSLWHYESDCSIMNVRKAEFQLPTKKKSKKLKSTQVPGTCLLELDALDITRIANGFENLDLPDQLSAVLENRKLQHLLLCQRDHVVIERLGYWIIQTIMDLARWRHEHTVIKSELHDMLRTLVKFTRFTKSQLPAIEYFLFDHLKTWNGFDFQDEIFELITYIKPADYHDFYTLVLMRLYRLFLVSDVKWKSKLIHCYTGLLNNWTLLDWNRHVQLRKTGGSAGDHMATAFGVLSFDINYFRTIRRFIEHVDRLSVMGLLAEDDHPFLQHASLTFFELVATISMQDDIPDIIIPAATFVHRSFSSSSAMVVSRICGILYRYKIAFEDNDNKTQDWMSKHTPAYVDHFNTYLLDVCNSLWKNIGLSNVQEKGNAFSLTKSNMLSFHRICKDRDMDISKLFSMTHSASLAAFSKRFMTQLEKRQGTSVAHDQPITSAYLRQLEENGGVSCSYPDYREAYLDYLNQLGFTGIHDLLYACMASLIHSKERKTLAQQTSCSTSTCQT